MKKRSRHDSIHYYSKLPPTFFRNICHFTVSVTLIIGLACDALLTTKPDNMAVLLRNKTISMKCRTDSMETKLIWRTRNSSRVFTMFNGKTFLWNNQSYSINMSMKGQFDLMVRTNSVTTARRYICEEPGNKSAGAELIILESTPNCCSSEISSEGRIALSCSVRFAGNWSPTMEWKEMMDQVGRVITNDVTMNRNQNQITSNLTIIVNSSIPPNTKYTCTTKFRKFDRPESTDARNVPSYSYTWIYPTAETTFTPDTESRGFTSTNIINSTFSDFESTTSSSWTEEEQTMIIALMSLSVLVCSLFVILMCVVRSKTSQGLNARSYPEFRREDVRVERHVNGPEVGNYCVVDDYDVRPTTPSISRRYYGADGTEYMEMNAVRRSLSPPLPFIQLMSSRSVVDKTVYASIDHTAAPQQQHSSSSRKSRPY